MSGMHENPIEHKHPTCIPVYRKRETKILNADGLQEKSMFCHANMVLANVIKSTETQWKSTTHAVVLHQTLFY